MMEEYFAEKSEQPGLVSSRSELPAKVDGHYVRGEPLQAREITAQLDIFENAGATGAFVYTFASQTSPFNPDPRYDMDMAGSRLVKSYPESDAVEGLIEMVGKQAKELGNTELSGDFILGFLADIGKHRSTYPEMPWEPKKSFRVVAEFFLKQ